MLILKPRSLASVRVLQGSSTWLVEHCGFVSGDREDLVFRFEVAALNVLHTYQAVQHAQKASE